jgi:hypothetical protein
MDGDAGVMVITGAGFTTAVMMELLVHPRPLTPVTVYVVVTVGVTAIELATVPPGFQV